MPMKVPAVRFVQKGVPMYLTALPVQELDNCSIDMWDPRRPGKWKGYQRGLIQKKIKSLAEYLERDDGILPVAGLLNVREKGSLRFSSQARRNTTAGNLTIPDGTRLWVVDMQHRLSGIIEAYSRGFLRDFSVPVLITEALQPVKEAAQFYIINTQAKKMGVDLTRRLLIEHGEIRDLTDVPQWVLKAVKTCIYLNRGIKGNPWYGRIREPESERMRDHVATEKTLVLSLRWLLTSPGAKNKSPRHLARFLANLWEGLRKGMPTVFDSPKSYMIQKTIGFMSFHQLAPIVYRKYKNRSVKRYSRLFRRLLPKYSEKFWRAKNTHGARRYGTGYSAYNNLAMDLKRQLGI